MICEKLSPECDDKWCECEHIRRVSDTGLRTLARERGLTVLTGEQAKRIEAALGMGGFCLKYNGTVWSQNQCDAAIRELEGAK